jgi:hypothetical protein
MELADKIEALDGPDRGVDLLIMRHVMNIGGEAADAKPYTASIDAAMTLVPLELQSALSLVVQGDQNQAIIYREGDGVAGRGDANTLSLAICAAALRAKENSND